MRALATLALLTALTWLAALPGFHFDSPGGALFGGDFPGAPDLWEVSGDPTRTRIEPDALRLDGDGTGHPSLVRAFPVDDAWRTSGRQLRVSGRIATERVPTRAPSDTSAAFIVWFLDSGDTAFGYATIASLTGDFGQRRVERVLDVPGRADRVVVALLGRAGDGAFALEGVSVEPVATTRAYTIALTMLVLAWAVYAALLGRWLHARLPRPATALVVALLAAVLIGVLMPEGVSGRFVLPLYYRVVEGFGVSRFVPLELLYKGGHFVFFLALSAALSACAPRLGVGRWSMFSALALLALATEGLQSHLVDRTARLGDVAIDVAAIALGTAALAWLGARSARRSAAGAGTASGIGEVRAGAGADIDAEDEDETGQRGGRSSGRGVRARCQRKRGASTR